MSRKKALVHEARSAQRIQANVPAAREAFAAGLQHQQAGSLNDAIRWYGRALTLKPDFPEAHNNLSNVLAARGRLEEAAAGFRAALSLRPAFLEAQLNLGDVLMRLGRLEEALGSFRLAVDLRPDFPDAHFNLGNALAQSGQLDAAVDSFERAIELRQDFPDAYNNLGNALKRLGKIPEAAACYASALMFRKDFADAYVNLGSALKDCGRVDQAIACYGSALSLRPDLHQAHNNLGIALASRGRLAEAVTSFSRALDLRPVYPEANINLGNVLRDSWRFDEATICFRKVLELDPDCAEAHLGLANVLKDQRHLGAAVASYRRAIDLRPDYPEAHNNLGNALTAQGRLDEALSHFARAFELKPDYFPAYSGQLFAQNYRLGQMPETLRDMAKQFGTAVASRVGRSFTSWSCGAFGRPLRVGLVSGDLCSHPVGYFLEGLLRAANAARIEFVAFPSHFREDELTARIKPCFASWTPIYGLEDEAAAHLIHETGVDVLLDLSGHTAYNRLPVFAWRPAPVQATWLGYFATTGVAEIDYIIGDPLVSPPEEAGHFMETVWPLPEIYYCFTAPPVAVEVSGLPALSSGHLTFGCFNNLTKINDAVVAVWTQILESVPGSRLMLKAPQLQDAEICKDTRVRFAAHGIGEDRLEIEPPSSRAEYLRAYHRVDIALDPFPYPGGTTTCEALWMGVPVLTRRGDRFLSHAGETIVHNAGLPDWIAEDDDDYVAKAVRLGSDLHQLADLRAGLRGRVLASPLFDADRFARHFEAAMRRMRSQWLNTSFSGLRETKQVARAIQGTF